MMRRIEFSPLEGFSLVEGIHSFIHSGYFYSASSSPLLLRGAPNYSIDTVSEFHAEAPQATASEGLAQGAYVAARTGFELATLRIKAPNLPIGHHAPNFTCGISPVE